MVKKGSSDYKKVRKRWFFKEPLTECFFVEPKMVILWHRCEARFKAPLFIRVYEQMVPYCKALLYFIYRKSIQIH